MLYGKYTRKQNHTELAAVTETAIWQMKMAFNLNVGFPYDNFH